MPSDGDRTLRSLLNAGETQQGAKEVAPKIFMSAGMGNSHLFATSQGHVLVNTGTLSDARRGRPLFAQAAPGELRYIVATQSYVAQMGGLEVYMVPGAQLIAQRAFTVNRADQLKLDRYYARRNRTLYGAIMDKAGPIAGVEFSPDIVVDERYALNLGGRQFELIATPGGETTDALVVWLPEERIVATGNLFGPMFGNHPNLNTVRGDKPRSALRYIDSVKLVRALGAETILSAHQIIRGREQIDATLGRIIDAVQWTHDRTIEGMNAGVPLYRLMRDIKVPAQLQVGEAHGKVAWNVRAIWHEYSGWFDYDDGTVALYDVPRSSVAPDLIALAGGVGPIVECAQRHLAADRPLEALHLLDLVPEDAAVLAVKRSALTRLQERSNGANFSETAWLRSAIASLQDIGNVPASAEDRRSDES